MTNYFNDFNSQFERALQSKLANQEADTQLIGAQEDIVAPVAQSAINLDTARSGAYDADALATNSQTNQLYGGPPKFDRGSAAPSAINRANIFSQSQPNSYSPQGSVFDQEPKGYAEGGPVDADYDLYRRAAADAGLPELDYQVAIPAMAQMRARQRAKVLRQIASGATTPGFAQGGEVDVGGALVQGTGTGKSDSIPAVIDGERPAALSNGEFIIPKNIVDYFGTKFFDGLVEKARETAGKQKRTADKAALAEGGVVPNAGAQLGSAR